MEDAILLDIIEGRGKWALFGRGITTYPLVDDENQKRIHAGCLRLCEQGKIHRHRITEGVTIWMPNTAISFRRSALGDLGSNPSRTGN